MSDKFDKLIPAFTLASPRSKPFSDEYYDEIRSIVDVDPKIGKLRPENFDRIENFYKKYNFSRPNLSNC